MIWLQNVNLPAYRTNEVKVKCLTGTSCPKIIVAMTCMLHGRPKCSIGCLMMRNFRSPLVCKPLESENPPDCQGFNPALSKQDGGQLKAGCSYVSKILEIRVWIVESGEKILFSQVTSAVIDPLRFLFWGQLCISRSLVTCYLLHLFYSLQSSPASQTGWRMWRLWVMRRTTPIWRGARRCLRRVRRFRGDLARGFGRDSKTTFCKQLIGRSWAISFGASVVANAIVLAPSDPCHCWDNGWNFEKSWQRWRS